MKLITFLTNELRCGRMVRGWEIPPSDCSERFSETTDAYYNRDQRIGCVVGLTSRYLGLDCFDVEKKLPRGVGGLSVAIEQNDEGNFEEAIELVVGVWGD